jgi:Peptidase propeptide and YPEB domain
VLFAALAVARTCGSRNQEISQEEAIAIATERADFEPCTQTGCVLVRALSQGIPSRLVWLVGLADDLDAEGEPTRVQNFVIDAATGEVTER